MVGCVDVLRVQLDGPAIVGDGLLPFIQVREGNTPSIVCFEMRLDPQGSAVDADRSFVLVPPLSAHSKVQERVPVGHGIPVQAAEPTLLK